MTRFFPTLDGVPRKKDLNASEVLEAICERRYLQSFKIVLPECTIPKFRVRYSKEVTRAPETYQGQSDHFRVGLYIERKLAK